MMEVWFGVFFSFIFFYLLLILKGMYSKIIDYVSWFYCNVYQVKETPIAIVLGVSFLVRK